MRWSKTARRVSRSIVVGCVAVVWGFGAAVVADPEWEMLDPGTAEIARALRDSALAEDEHAWQFVEGLTTEVGPRLAGSDGDRRAVVWAQKTLEAWGFDRVWTEPVTVPRWVRGHASASIVAPFPQPVVVVALGGSVGTPDGGIEAEVVEVADMAALEAADPNAYEGKIVFVSQRMERTQDGRGYGTAVGKRVGGASAAAAKGAVAVVIRSAGTSRSRVAHTGTMRYADGVPKIPAAALSNADADLLAAQVRRGRPVRFHLDLGCRTLGDTESANVFAEVRGRERPDEIVLLVGHLDSWDLGTGAVDDGAGCGIAAAAARRIAALPTRPRRSVVVWLTANEEFGLSGARAHAEQHADRLEAFVAGLESDLGAAAPWALRSRVPEPLLPMVRDLARLLEPLGIAYQGNEGRGGADLSLLMRGGMPVLDLPQDARPYFDVHHTADDTLDKVDPKNLRINVAAYATAAYLLAEIDRDLGRMPVTEGSRRR